MVQPLHVAAASMSPEVMSRSRSVPDGVDPITDGPVEVVVAQHVDNLPARTVVRRVQQETANIPVRRFGARTSRQL